MKISALSAMCGLSIATIEKINAVFAMHPELTKVLLYGSRAKGNYRLGSDVDLTLIGDTLTYAQLGEMATQLDDLLLPYTFDVSLINKIDNPDLVDHIRRVGIVFYEL